MDHRNRARDESEREDIYMDSTNLTPEYLEKEIKLEKERRIPWKKILVIFLVLLLGSIGGNALYWHHENTPEVRLERVAETLQQGNFKGLSNYTTNKDMFTALNIFVDGNESQQKELAKILYKNASVKVTNVSYNSAKTKAYVDADISNYNVYSAALTVELSEKEQEGKTMKERRDLLVQKTGKAVESLEKKGGLITNSVSLVMVNKDGKWMLDGNQDLNQMAILAFLGIQVGGSK